MRRWNDVRAVVLGLEINGLSVVRSLGRNRVRVVGVDQDLEQATALSKYLLSRIHTPQVRGPEVVDTLVELAGDGRRYALFPTMDATVLQLSEERARLPENLLYRLPEHETVCTLMHKGSFRALCKEADLPAPGYAVAADLEALEAALESLRFPLVMKTTIKRMGPSPKAVILEDINQAVAAYREQGEGEMILEEWIPGTDRDVFFCLQAYGGDMDLLASFSGRKVRQWPPLVGGTASAEPVDLPELEEMTTRFFKSVRYRGMGSMEYKHDPRNGRYYAIEPTVGRTDFQSGIAPANGVNIPLAVFSDMVGAAQKPGRRRGEVKWRDPVGDTRSALHYVERGELTRKEWMKSLAGPCVSTLFAWDDPAPWVSDLFRRGVGRLKRLLNRNEEIQ